MAGEWPITTFAKAPIEIIDGDRGKNYPSQSEFHDTGHCLFLNAGNVTESGFDFSSCAFISEEKDRLLRKGKLARHDVVLTTRGTVGNSAYFDDSVPYEILRINSGMVILRAKQRDLHPRYLYMLIRSKLFHEQVSALRTGSAQPQLPIRDIQRIEIPIPPLPEQRAIAHILGTLDDKIELNRRMNQTLEEIARAIFKSWFIDFDPVIDNALASGKPIPEELRKRAEIRTGQNQPLPLPSPSERGWQKARSDGTYGVRGEGAVAYHRLFPDEFQDSPFGKIPKGWEVKRFSEIVEINPPRTLKKGTTAPYVDMASLPTSGSQLESPPAVREYKSGSRFQNGDVLFARITPCLENGKTVLVNSLQDGVVAAGSTEFLVFGPRLAGSHFAYCASRWDTLRDHAIASMTGTSGRQRAQKGAFDHFEMAAPDEELLSAFEKRVARLFLAQRRASLEIASLAATRNALLPKLLSGDLRASPSREAARFPDGGG